MDDPLTGDFASRLADEEEEAEAQSSADALLHEPDIEWQAPLRDGDDTATGQADLLVVAVGPAACALMLQCAAGDPIGTITLAEMPAPEDALPRRDRARHVSEVHRLHTGGGSSGGPLLICAEEAVPAERAAAWVRGVFSSSTMPAPERVLVLSSMPAHEYRGPGDPSEDVLLFEASTTAAPAAVHENGSMSADAAVGHVQRLPSGTLVSGLPAAILSNCQVRGRAATLLLGVQMGQLPDASFLQGFAAATARRLSVLGYEMEAAALLDKQTVLSAHREVNKRLISDATSAMYT